MKNQSNQNKIIKTANKIIWVERWVTHYTGEFSEWEGITADRLPNGKWESTLKLPMIDEIVTVTSDTELGAVLKMGDIQAKLLKEYLEEHKEVKFPPLSRTRNWRITADENGRVESVGRSSEVRRREGEALRKLEQQCVGAVEKAIQRINKICGSTRGIVIHAYDKNLFPKMDEKDYIHKEANRIHEEIDDESYTGVTINSRGQYVITIGYADIKDKGDESYEA